MAQDVSDWRRNITLCENSCRHLVQQRLEKVIIVAIEDRDVNLSVSQSSGCEQTAEAAAQDHDTMPDLFRLTISEIGCCVGGLHGST